ncbi:hypothetical protein EDD86DRAFT_208506 [Gorgonomyces haynaldii]|nr:hypothetical protein EDD86DRAFT_208506 [Gorgonomyces haynaldii]
MLSFREDDWRTQIDELLGEDLHSHIFGQERKEKPGLNHDVVSFQALINENTADVMTEAKSLLREWLDKPEDTLDVSEPVKPRVKKVQKITPSRHQETKERRLHLEAQRLETLSKKLEREGSKAISRIKQPMQIESEIAQMMIQEDISEKKREVEKKIQSNVTPIKRDNKLVLKRVEQLYLQKTRDVKKRVFLGWKSITKQFETDLLDIQALRHWKSLNQCFVKWKHRQSTRIHKREQAMRENEQRHIQQQWTRALRHDRLHRISQAFIQWRCYILKEKEERLQRERQLERERQMQAFLLKLEQKHQQFVSQSLDPERATTARTHAPSSQKSDIRSTTDTPSTDTSKTPAKREQKESKWVKQMKEREHQRLLKKQQLETLKRERLEQEKLAEEKKRMEEQERLREEREQLMKERLRIEEQARMLLEEKERERQKLQEKMTLAVENRTVALKRDYGMRPWLQFIREMREREQEAVLLYNKSLKKRSYAAMKTKIQQKVSRMEQMALKHYKKQHLITHLASMHNRYTQILALFHASDRLYTRNCLKAAFQKYRAIYIVTREQRMERERIGTEKADQLSKKLVPKRVLRIWRQFVQETKEEKWREYRRECMRQSVKGMLLHSTFEHHLETTHSWDRFDHYGFQSK